MEAKIIETLKKSCENPDCEDPCAMPLTREDGRHNFVPHIIDGRQVNVCLACKVKLLQNGRKRNGF